MNAATSKLETKLWAMNSIFTSDDRINYGGVDMVW